MPHYEENIYSASDKVETITIAEKDTPIQIINSNSKLVLSHIIARMMKVNIMK